MQMTFEHPWFILLWIVLLSILLLPIIVGGVNAVVNNYFQAKEKHIAKLVKAVGEIFKDGLSHAKTEVEKRKENSNEGV